MNTFRAIILLIFTIGFCVLVAADENDDEERSGLLQLLFISVAFS